MTENKPESAERIVATYYDLKGKFGCTLILITILMADLGAALGVALIDSSDQVIDLQNDLVFVMSVLAVAIIFSLSECYKFRSRYSSSIVQEAQQLPLDLPKPDFEFSMLFGRMYYNGVVLPLAWYKEKSKAPPG